MVLLFGGSSVVKVDAEVMSLAIFHWCNLMLIFENDTECDRFMHIDRIASLRLLWPL
jgi:hypothetical protein